MIASLPMYATPLTAAAYDRFWALIRDHLRGAGVDAPDALTTDTVETLEHWRDPALLLSQTCGLPYRAALKDHVALVGTPDFGLPDCPPGYYNSVVILREEDPATGLDDLIGAAFAYNDPLSQSGWAALALTRPDILTGPKHCTGSHRASAAAVRAGAARFATIDAQTWRQLGDLGETGGLKVIHRTVPVPGLPLVTTQMNLVPFLQEAVRNAITALAPEDRAMLRIRDLIAMPPTAYDLPIPPSPDAING